MRLTDPRAVPTGEPFTFTFEGRAIEALPGETIGTALSAAGILAFRHTASGVPRGLHCGMGACWDCLVAVGGHVNQRACMTKAKPGMQVTGTCADLPAPLSMPWPSEEARAPDVLVVGAGPAGLSAAIAAAEAGAGVLVLDERAEAGGQYLKDTPAHAVMQPDRQFRAGYVLRARAKAAGVEILQDSVAWGAFPPGEVHGEIAPAPDPDHAATVAALRGGHALALRPRRLILASGAHERPVPIPGWTLPGVMTTGAMQTLVRSGRVSPAERVVIAGNGPLNLQLAAELLAGGATVAAVVETAPRPGPRAWRDALRMGLRAPDLAWDGTRYLLALRRAGVPVIWGATLLGCEGEDSFTALRIATASGEQRIAAGVLALNHGFQAETGLARALGAAHRVGAAGTLETVTEEDGRTSVPGVFAVGDGAVMGGARAALARGRLAGLTAARDLGHAVPDDAADRRALHRALRFQAALWRLYAAPPLPVPTGDTIACRCEEVPASALQGHGGAVAARRATRAGMGRCGGRFCGATLHAILGAASGEAGFAAPRAPVRPVPAAALMREAPSRGHHHGTADPPLPAWTTAPPAPVPADCDVLVIGGGVVGLSCALHLARNGADVLVADRGEPGLGASTTNAGSLHIQLLAYDFDDTGDPGPLVSTLALGPASVALWREIARDAGEELSIRTEGGLILADDADTFGWLTRKVAFESARGIEATMIGAEEVRRIAPALDRRFVGAAWCPQEGQMDPLRGTAALIRLARAAGARIVPGLDVTAMEPSRTGFRVTTPGGTFHAGRVVNAAGPHAMRVAAMLGARLPMRLIVQQVVVTEPGPPMLRPLVQWARRHLSLKQGDGGHLLIGGGWPGRLDADGAARLLRWSVQGNLDIAGRAIPALSGLHALRAWAAPNILLDRGPVISETPGTPGFFHAVTSNGWTLGPIAGRMVAEAVLGRETPPPAFALG
ncbi:FAD-dependent oxidoreductase [Muricoccus radiodurans]|uniref:FAD-dependent oxidoreductase n=1 Tax=Muricoccus radiodurans TaxID=2231721 RepID=UPI003CF93D49